MCLPELKRLLEDTSLETNGMYYDISEVSVPELSLGFSTSVYLALPGILWSMCL